MAKKKTAVKASRAAAEPHTGCAAGVCDPERTQGLKAPAWCTVAPSLSLAGSTAKWDPGSVVRDPEALESRSKGSDP